MENIARRADDALLPDRLHPHRHPRGCGVLPRAVPPREPAALQAGLHDRRRHQGRGPLRRHAHGVGREQQRLVGRGRDQVLHGRRHRRIRPSAAPAPKTTSAARTTSRTRRRSSTRSSRRPTPACRWSSDPTASTTPSSASGSTAGTSSTRSASSRTCGSRSRRSAGAPAVATCRCRTTSPRWRTGIRPSRTRRFRRCPRRISWKSSEVSGRVARRGVTISCMAEKADQHRGGPAPLGDRRLVRRRHCQQGSQRRS